MLHDLQGGSALTNRSKRFDLVLATSPGPGSYNINTEWVKDTICLAPSSAPPTRQQDKACKGTVSYSVVCTVSADDTKIILPNFTTIQFEMM